MGVSESEEEGEGEGSSSGSGNGITRLNSWTCLRSATVEGTRINKVHTVIRVNKWKEHEKLGACESEV